MIDIFKITTKKNTYTFYFFNDKIFETNISYNYHRNYYLNNRDLWEYCNLKKSNIIKNHKGKFLIKFN
jgi:hypothetical protein